MISILVFVFVSFVRATLCIILGACHTKHMLRVIKFLLSEIEVYFIYWWRSELALVISDGCGADIIACGSMK